MWDWLLKGENLSWVILGIAGIWFVFTGLPGLIHSIKNTPEYDEEDIDPSGNANINR